MFTLTQLISFLRESVNVQDPTTTDTAFLSMSDSDIGLIIAVAYATVNPSGDVNAVDNKEIYPLILLSKKELFYRLSVLSAPLYTVGFNNSSVRKSDRYEHYMGLVKEVDAEYKYYIERGQPVQVSNILLVSSRFYYYSKGVYDKMTKPTVYLAMDGAYSDHLDISWSCTFEKFGCSKVYVTKGDYVVDTYNENKIMDDAILIATYYDPHTLKCRIPNLLSGNQYTVCVQVFERNSLMGYAEMKATTK